MFDEDASTTIASAYTEPSSEASPASNGKQPALQPQRSKLNFGPLTEVHAFWVAGMSCDGCSIAAVGATAPSVESLMLGVVPGMPKLILHHPVLAVEAGEGFMRPFYQAEEGNLGAPYVLILEGSIADERIAAQNGGYWSACGVEVLEDGTHRPIPSAEWIKRLAPGAAAVIAMGTCATWGGVPAAAGNPTGSMSLMDYLGWITAARSACRSSTSPAARRSATTSLKRSR